MAEQVMDCKLAAELVADIEARVGKVGLSAVDVSEYGERYSSIALSRGGIVTPRHSMMENYEARRREHTFIGGDKKGQLIYPDAPQPTQPLYKPDLAVIQHLVGINSEEGIHNGDSVTLSRMDSHEYVFTQGEDGLWRVCDAYGQSSDNYWTKTTEYFLDASRPVTTTEEGLAIRGLITLFDTALTARSQAAVENESGLLPAGH